MIKRETKAWTIKVSNKEYAEAKPDERTAAAKAVLKERPVEVVEAIAVVEKPQSSVKLSTEHKSSVPVFQVGEPVDLVAEGSKLAILPKQSCNSCTIGPSCPKYEIDAVCAYEAAFRAFPMRDVQSVLAVKREVLEGNIARLRMARLQEQVVSGGAYDPQVTKISEVVDAQLTGFLELSRSVQKVDVTVLGEEPARKGGILSQLFGPAVERTVVDLNPDHEIK